MYTQILYNYNIENLIQYIKEIKGKERSETE